MVIVTHFIMIALDCILGTVIACGFFILLMLPATIIIVFSTWLWKTVTHWKERQKSTRRLPNESQLDDFLKP
jgi:hypothetical protein